VTATPGDLYEIPTLSGLGVAIFVLALLGAAVAFLVRQRQ
jgi:hypothetical protein